MFRSCMDFATWSKGSYTTHNNISVNKQQESNNTTTEGGKIIKYHASRVFWGGIWTSLQTVDEALDTAACISLLVLEF